MDNVKTKVGPIFKKLLNLDRYYARYKDTSKLVEMVNTLLKTRNVDGEVFKFYHEEDNVVNLLIRTSIQEYSQNIVNALADLPEKTGVCKMEFMKGPIIRVRIQKKEVEIPKTVKRRDAAGNGIYLGINTETGEPLELNLNYNPHLLIAGSTGQGKSVCLENIIMYIDEFVPDAELIMIDPKRIELSEFKNLKRLKYPIVTDPIKALDMLREVVSIMDSRYRQMEELGTKNYKALNEGQIFLIVDEYADLMMVANSLARQAKKDEDGFENDLELNIARIGQLGRAAGIHIILATQRPSADVVTGLIKANIPTRIAFSTASDIDSRIILDETVKPSQPLPGYGVLRNESGFHKFKGVYIAESEIKGYITQTAPDFSVRAIKKELPSKYYAGIPEDDIKKYLDEEKGKSWKNLNFRKRFAVSHSAANEFGNKLMAMGVLEKGQKRARFVFAPEKFRL